MKGQGGRRGVLSVDIDVSVATKFSRAFVFMYYALGPRDTPTGSTVPGTGSSLDTLVKR